MLLGMGALMVTYAYWLVYSTGAISYVAMHLALRHMSTQQELYLQELVWFYCMYERYIGEMEETDKLMKLCIQVYNLN